MPPVKLTHKGWFGICPVYFGDLEKEAPLVIERHFLFEPLLWLSHFIFMACAFIAAFCFCRELDFPLLVTGAAPEDLEVSEWA